MTDDNGNACQASESCPDPRCHEHRFDLYAALVGVADAWVDSLPQEPLSRRSDMESAFFAVARLAAAEVLGSSRRQWVAVSVDVFDSDLGVDLRDEFGPVGLCMWIGFLTACKRNQVPGKIRYSSDAECLSLMGVPALELVDEEGEPFKLDDFWSFLGQHKQTRVTRSKRLVDVTCTRWERWQKSAKRQTEAERKSSVRGSSERTEPGHDADEKRTDRDIDKDKDTDPPDFVRFWTEYPRREGKGAARKAWKSATKIADPDEIIEAARLFAENTTARKIERRFIAHPATWLNRESWTDELPDPEGEEGEGVTYR